MYALPLAEGPWQDAILVGLGEAAEADLESWREAVGRGLRSARSRGARSVAVALSPALPAAPADVAAAAAEAGLLACYRFTEFREPRPEEGRIERLLLAAAPPAAAPADGASTGSEALAGAVGEAEIVARAACWARDLINASPSDKRPPRLADRARAMADEVGLACEVIDERAAAELGMNALLAVGRGSAAPPRLVVLEHRGDGEAEEAPVVLVGKGVTFDSGGISIKPARNMDEMKADMSGAAAVLGAMRAAAQLGLPRRIVGVVPMAENLPGPDSYRPGDLIRAYGGKTIEVLNTDAEGRLILADALAYARERFAPACMVDLATLTGACVVALGEQVAGLMSNDEELAGELLAAAEQTGERIWRLPLFAHYRKQIDSRVADIKNTGGRWGGAITAAKFLEEFVGDTPWAHLDIAGPAYSSKDAPYRPRGGQGFGVRLLLRWLRRRDSRR